ncbi:MAG: Cys-tRNA(Pro) deacylase [Pseudomonadota bacterium]
MTPAIKLLDRHKIDYQVRQYESGDELRHFGEHAAAQLGQAPEQVFKTLMGIIDGNTRKPVVALVAVADQLNLKKLAAECRGRKAVLAEPAQAERSSGYLIGGISPLGQRQQLSTLIDHSAESFDSIFISGGKRGLQLELSPQALVSLLDARFCPLAR